MSDAKIFAEFFECASNRWELELCQRVAEQYGADARVYLWASSQADAMRLDEFLWTYEEGSFIPHALWSGEQAFAEQISVGCEAENPNSATVLIVGGPQPLDRLVEFAGSFKRVIDFVPTRDQRATAAARERYKALSGAGFTMRFHSAT